MPRPGALSDDAVWRLSVAYIRSAGGVCGRPAGWRVSADQARLSQPGSRLLLCASIAGLGGGILWRPRAQLVDFNKLLITMFGALGICLYINTLWVNYATKDWQTSCQITVTSTVYSRNAAYIIHYFLAHPVHTETQSHTTQYKCFVNKLNCREINIETNQKHQAI